MNIEIRHKVRDALMDWYIKNKRQCLWREEGTTPFKVLIAEIFLRHTRAVVVDRVYRAFIQEFPTPASLISAPEKRLIKLMRPLGIVSRVKQVREIAEIVEIDFCGEVPQDRQSLKSIHGVGEYTASAVRVFAFNKRDILIDTNIFRVLSRLIERTDLIEIKRVLREMSKTGDCRDFFYMLLDFGAVVCKAKGPMHEVCPVNDYCCYYKSILLGKSETH